MTGASGAMAACRNTHSCSSGPAARPGSSAGPVAVDTDASEALMLLVGETPKRCIVGEAATGRRPSHHTRDAHAAGARSDTASWTRWYVRRPTGTAPSLGNDRRATRLARGRVGDP